MGRYMRKGKITGEVALVMGVAPHSTLGVRTRAKTLALQRLLLQDAAASRQPESSSCSSSYLQLRNRRLEKPPAPKAKVAASCKGGGRRRSEGHDARGGGVSDSRDARDADADEVSFGENVPELESKSRDIRETTPCSQILGSDFVGTPGSSTRPGNLSITSHRVQNAATHRDIPTSQELEEFFGGAEQLQQRMFLEKYNYDCVNDSPLPGRFEWVRFNS